MSGPLLRLVLLVSCAHALVHVYELSIPSVEQRIADDYSSEIANRFDKETEATGLLSWCFRLPFGLLAILTGLVADRFGSRRMLLIYLWGCAAASFAAALVGNFGSLFLAFFALGTFASIYHPAGLALISHETSAENRPRALGLHGIFGSLGIGGAPFLAGMALSVGASWQQYYLLLAGAGAALAFSFVVAGRREANSQDGRSAARPATPAAEDAPRWTSFAVLTVFGATTGFIYAGFLTFLPRYMSEFGALWSERNAVEVGNYLTGGVLLLGIFGQYTAGRIARPDRLEALLAGVLLINAPLLAWMSVAQGPMRPVAAGLFALVHFMNQPLYNSMIASYTPRRKRSLCYGFSFLMSFGIGSLGSVFAGYVGVETAYGMLALLALVASAIAGGLWLMNRT